MKLKEKPEDFVVREIPNISLTPQGNYLIYRLKKKLWNTENAVQEVARKLKISRKKIGYSGAKDRKAVTEQYISIQAPREKIEALKIKDIQLEYVGRAKKQISLGQHLGNEFEIIARECENSPKKKRFIVNRFGEQRFSRNNAEIGRAIVRKDFKRACKLIDNPKVKEHLQKHKNDYVGALKKVPLKIATMYVHAYQSLLWNRAAETAKDVSVPILGFGTSEEDVRKCYSDADVEAKDFIIRQWPELSSEGSERMLHVPLENLRIEKLSENTYKLKFFLPKGSYATVAVRQLFQK